MGNGFQRASTLMNIGSNPIIRGKQANVIFNTAIIGGGKACYNLLKLLDKDRSKRLKFNIIGVADVNSDSPGFRYAKELNLFTTTDPHRVFDIEGLNLIIELTGSTKVAEEISRVKPPNISFIDHVAIRLLWDLIQMEYEKIGLEKDWQRRLEVLKKQNKAIPDSLPYRIMVINKDKTVETVNQTFLNDYNLTEDMVLGKSCYELKLDVGRPCNGCFLDDRLEEIREKGLFSTYIEYTDDNGESRFDAIILTPIFDEEGDIVQLLESSRDVTQRIKLEREAQKSNTFLQNVIQSTVDGIVVTDAKGNVLIFNEGMERLTGFSADEMADTGHLSMFYDIDLARENMKKMRSDQYGPPGKLNPISMSITTKHGNKVPVTLSASIITIDNKEVGSVGVFTDMREILEMRKNLEDAHIQLVQAEKIATIGKMAAGVAHEINNPLSGIMIYAELFKDKLKKELKGDSQDIDDIQKIVDQTLRCKKIVSELLEFSRQSVEKVSSFSVEELINKTLNLLINQALFQDIEVRKDIEKDLPAMVGDMGQLQQVFTNLFINAADAMDEKGILTIKARFDKQRDLIIIKISDTGLGIPKELRDKIFDIFFTTKKVGKGTGLGLSIIQNIIKLHGGNIAMDSPSEGGTIFTIELPINYVEHPVDEPIFMGLDE